MLVRRAVLFLILFVVGRWDARGVGACDDT
jgi:hypothetical protein